MATSSQTHSAQSLHDLFEAALMLAPADRAPFLTEVCTGEPHLRAELEALLASEPRLLALRPEDRVRISGLFHAAFALPPDARRPFLDRACANRPDDRDELASLLRHAEDSGFLERPAAPVSQTDRLETGPGGSGARRDLPPAPTGPAYLARVDVLLAKIALGDADGAYSLARSLWRAALDTIDPSGGLTPRWFLFRELPNEAGGAPPGGGGGAPPGEHLVPLIGRKVRDYEILRKLGEGGMGIVYLALDTKLQMHVAIKVVRPEYAANADYRRRLVSEAQLAARLSHPNIAPVHALLEEGSDVYMVSEYVPGPSLRNVVAQGPLPYARLVEVFTGMARGLDAAHTKGIIHRDLKPENVLLTEDDVPKIVDFGLAKSTRAILSSTCLQTQAGSRAGTPAYMAPEQIDEPAGQPLDFRCDLFAFGVTLYEAATGINPFEGRSLWSTLENIKHVDPPSLTKVRPGPHLDPLDAIIQRCLRKKPLDRYGSTKELLHDLEQLWGSDRSNPLPTPSKVDRPWWQIHQLAMMFFSAGALIFLWLVYPLARPLWASLLLAFAALVNGVPLIGIRAHHCFAWRFQPATVRRDWIRCRRAVRVADWAFSAIFAAMAGLMLSVDRPGTAAPLLILAVANAVIFLVVEPAAETGAFADTGDDDRRHP
jgi:hypothetical protein